MQQQASVILQAVALETSGQTVEALQLYRMAAQSPDTLPHQIANAWFRVGLLEEKLGRADEALRAWTIGAETSGNPDLSRRCAFHAACALSASGKRNEAAEWLRRLLTMPGSGEPVERAIRWKLVSVEPASAELPPTAYGTLEALLAIEAGFVLEQRDEVHKAAEAYRLALATGALDEASKANAELRLAIVTARGGLRTEAGSSDGTFDILHAEIWSALQRDDLALAHRLALRMPLAEPETAARIGHMLIATGFRLESTGKAADACELYSRAAQDEGLPETDRTNAAYRLALLLAAAGNRKEALAHFQHAVTSPDDGVHSAATLQLVHHLIGDSDWSGALALCGSRRINVDDLGQLLAVRAVQCQACLDRLPETPEQAVEALPGVVAAHAGAWMDAALACESAEHYRVACALYERLLQSPELPADIRANVHFRLGLAMDRMMMWTEAQPFLRRAADSQEAWPETRAQARYRLANIHYLLDQYDLALAEYDRLRADADATPPIRADAQFKHGMCLYRLERIEEASRDFRTCRAIGGEIEVKAEFILAEIAESRRDYAAARESYNRIVQHAHANPVTKTGAFHRLRDLPKR